MTLTAILLSIAVVVGLIVYLSLRTRGRVSASSDGLESLLRQLEAADFFGYVSNEEMMLTRDKILQGGWLFPEELGRSFFADDEYLVEGGLVDFLGSVSHFLEKQGVRLPLKRAPGPVRVTRDPKTGERIEVRTVRWSLEENSADVPDESARMRAVEHKPESGEYYKLEIGGLVQEIWNQDMTPGQASEAAVNHTLLLLNEVLRRTDSPERVYMLDNGSNYEAVFLTENQFELIAGAPLPQSSKPWPPSVVE